MTGSPSRRRKRRSASNSETARLQFNPGTGRTIPGQPRPVDQLREETGPVGSVQQLDPGQVGDELRTGIHNLAEPRGRGLDLVVKVDGFMGGAVSGEPGATVVEPPGPPAIGCGGLLQSRIVAPDQIRLDVLQSFGKECFAAPAGDCRDAIAAVGCVGPKFNRPPEQIEIETAAGLDIGQQPGPAFQHRIECLGGSAIERAGGDAADAQQLTIPGQAGPAVSEITPPGQLFGQRAGRIVFGAFTGKIHPFRPLKITRHGSAIHLAGS